ncbi:MAG TPA: signal peptidase I [Pseudonocardiaceae bacterium]|nr:signal peptidase I [Pseudonocardiaceae bacterium]
MLQTARSPRHRLLPALIVFGALVLAGGLTLVIHTSVGKAATATSELRYASVSMGDTIPKGAMLQYTVVSSADIHRGDIVVVDNGSWIPPGTADALVVKRVIGVGGDTVSCCDATNRIQVNGKPITEDYLTKHPVAPAGVHQQFPPVLVPSGEFFLAGDDRSNSLDSRELIGAHYGRPTVAASAIKGRVVAIGNGVRFTPVIATSAFIDAGLPNGSAPEGSTGTNPVIVVSALVVIGLGVLGLLVLGIIALGTRRKTIG